MSASMVKKRHIKVPDYQAIEQRCKELIEGL